MRVLKIIIIIIYIACIPGSQLVELLIMIMFMFVQVYFLLAVFYTKYQKVYIVIICFLHRRTKSWLKWLVASFWADNKPHFYRFKSWNDWYLIL